MGASLSRAVRLMLCAGSIIGLVAAPAQAALVSTAGPNFTPVIFDGSGPATLNIDINGDGTTDFVVSGGYNDGSQQGGGTPVTIAAGSNSVYDNITPLGPGGRVIAFPDANFAVIPAYASSYYAGTSFQAGTSIIANQPSGGYSLFHFIGQDANQAGQHAGFIEVEILDPISSALTVGYIAGTYFDGANASHDATFTVTDFGLDDAAAAALPEPASLLLLGAAAFALVAQRRTALRAHGANE